MPKRNSCDVLIVGAGPSGLAAASCCLHEGMDFLVVERGPELEQRNLNISEHLVMGVGGAGLFSDGKLSYYPSSHLLWNLQNTSILENAYNWLHNLIADFSDKFPPFPSHIPLSGDGTQYVRKGIRKKDYRSFVMSPDQRKSLLTRLLAPIKHKILTHHSLVAVDANRGHYVAEVVNNEDASDTKLIKTTQVIYCGGRFGPILLKKLLPELNYFFRRFEYGIRIEQRAKEFFLRDWQTIDAKLLLTSQDNSLEWRTFCCCREGTVLNSTFDDYITCSGAALCESSLSNIGFNARICSPTLYNELQHEIDNIDHDLISKTTLSSFMACKTNPLFGDRLDQFLREGLNLLHEKFGPFEANIYAPCIEGVGYYPSVSTSLEAEYPGLYVAGDSTGLFRGLLPAFLSGYYAARMASAKHSERNLQTELKINRSATTSMSMVFTAQSKKYFYCRDAVCEYVFNRGKLPINPFRIFDYFLSDRVSRDLVRQGNNHLVRTCDELWVFGPIADGVLFEVMHALAINKPVLFFNIATRANEIVPLEDIKDIKFEPEVHSSRQKRTELLSAIRQAFDTYQKPKQLRIKF